MSILSVLDLVGHICVDPDEGAILREQAHGALSRGESVVVDFSGVTALTSSFLNSTVGRLLSSFAEDDFRSRFRWTGLDQTDEQLVQLVIQNAVRFYAASPDQQLALVAATNQATTD
jgi:hypothetical protein